VHRRLRGERDDAQLQGRHYEDEWRMEKQATDAV
jgi:hypothetical protein